jgi:hypothetical protein
MLGVLKGGSLRAPPCRGPKAPGMRPLRATRRAGRDTQGTSKPRMMSRKRTSSSIPIVQLAATASRPPSGPRYAIGSAEPRLADHAHGSGTNEDDASDQTDIKPWEESMSAIAHC